MGNRDGQLDGKTALITGAGTGIGRETALMLAEEGATVVLVGRRQHVLDEVAAVIEDAGGTAFTHSTHVENADEVRELVDWTRDAAGPVDILVNNGGRRQQGRRRPLDRRGRVERRHGRQPHRRLPAHPGRPAGHAEAWRRGSQAVRVVSFAARGGVFSSGPTPGGRVPVGEGKSTTGPTGRTGSGPSDPMHAHEKRPGRPREGPARTP